MDKVKFELNLKGLNELMKSPEMQAHLQQAGDAVASSASSLSGGEAYGVRVHNADFVSIANVYPNSREAAKCNLEHNVLEKAVGTVGLPRSK